jgi:hypothetical protein
MNAPMPITYRINFSPISEACFVDIISNPHF